MSSNGTVVIADTLDYDAVRSYSLTITVTDGGVLRGSLPKSGPLDFATKNTFALFFVGEEALVGVC